MARVLRLDLYTLAKLFIISLAFYFHPALRDNMPLLKIVTAPHPVLKKKARPVREDEFGWELEEFVNSMLDTMYAEKGIGLAAPQVGDSRRILVAEPRYKGEDGDDVAALGAPREARGIREIRRRVAKRRRRQPWRRRL